ncbi:MAG: hypothetical protein M3552_09295, partial [Planctomycetota bacterium]|nr:hypothetical protein [Planctomycetota bacterium]
MTSDLATVPGDAASERSGRVLVLMTNRKDADRTADVLAAAGLRGIACADGAHLCHELQNGADALLLTEEAIYADRERRLQAVLAAQPPWSSIPLVAIVREGAARRIPDVVGDAAYAAFEQHVHRVLKGERVTFEVEIPYSDDSQWMRCGYEPEFDAAGH